MHKFYFDSDVWLGLIKKEQLRKYYVKDLLNEIVKNGDTICISIRHYLEMRSLGYAKEFNKILKELRMKTNIEFIKLNNWNFEEAKLALKQIQSFSDKIGFGDCIHFQAVRKVKAIPISYDRDWKDLANFYNIRVYAVEEVLWTFYYNDIER